MYRLVYCGTLPPEVVANFQPIIALSTLQPGHTITFGRASDNDVCLAVTGLPPSCETSKTAVSRHHAQLSLEVGSGSLLLRDLGTVNGTFVDGYRLPPNSDFLVPLDARGRAELIFGGNSAVQEGESPEEYARKGKLMLRSFAFYLERAGPPGGGALAADAAAAEQAAAAARQLLATTGTLVSAAADAGEGRAGRAGPAGGSGSGSKRGSGSGSGSGSASGSGSGSKASPEPLDRGEGASAGAPVSAAATAAVALAAASAAAAEEAEEARAADDAEDSDGMATEMEGESQRAHAASRIPSGVGAAAAAGAGAGASSSAAAAAADSTSPLKRHKSSGHYMELKARVVSISQRMCEVQAQVAQLSAELQGLVKDLQ